MNFINEVYAMAGQGGQGQGGGFFGFNIIFIVLIFFVLYMFMIRPQRKKQQEHQKFIDALKKGDEVITDSGIIGKVWGIADKVVTLEIADNVRIKIFKWNIRYSKNAVEETKTN